MQPSRSGPETASPGGAPGGVVPAADDAPSPARDVMVGLFILAWACVGWISVAGSSRIFMDAGLDPGPALLPLVVLGALSAGGLAILATGVAGLLRAGSRPAAPRMPLAQRLRPHLVPVALLATMAVYPTVMRGIGYAAATVIFVLGWTLALTAWRLLPDRRARLLAAVAAVAASAAVVGILYGGFVVIIHAPLP